MTATADAATRTRDAAPAFADRDRVMALLLWGHGVALAAWAVLHAALDPVGLRDLGWREATAVAALAAVATGVPLWHRSRASTPRAWRVAALVGLALSSYLLIYLAGGGFGVAAHLVLVVGLAAWYADPGLPWVPVGVAAVLHPGLTILEPTWLAVPPWSAVEVAGRFVLVVLAAAVASVVARSFHASLLESAGARAVVERSSAQHRAAQAASRANEDRLQTIVDALPEGIVILDPSGRVTFSNLAAARLLGTTRHALVQRSCTDPGWPLRPGPPGKWTGGLPFTTVARTGDAVVGLRCSARRGSEDRSMEATLIPLRDANERVSSIVVSFVDVTDRERARDELESMRRQVAMNERASALGSLISGVFHEIRTPLTYQQNNLHTATLRLDRLAKQYPETEQAVADVRELLDIAREGTTRINTLVNDLRRFTRAPEGGRASVGLHDVVDEAVRLFRVTNRGAAEVLADLHPTAPCRVDRAQIQQVVLNLLENAAHAAGPRGKVRVQTRAAQGAAEIVVIDTGPGIAPEVRERIFDEFFTTKPEGTGLGLSIVRRIVKAHDGTVKCTSEPGLTRFVVTLPLDKNVATARPTSAPPA